MLILHAARRVVHPARGPADGSTRLQPGGAARAMGVSIRLPVPGLSNSIEGSNSVAANLKLHCTQPQSSRTNG